MSRGTGRSRRGAGADSATLSLFGDAPANAAAVVEGVEAPTAPVETSGEETRVASVPVASDAVAVAEDEAPREHPETWLAQAFAEHMAALATHAGAPPESVQVVREAAYAVSVATSAGHACIDIAAIGKDFVLTRAALLGSKLVDVAPGVAQRPFVLDAQGRLYLHRYFAYEQRIAQRLGAMGGQALSREQESDLATRLAQLFGSDDACFADGVNRQKLAAALAVLNELTVISGGPGTGKTTTVVNVLACLLELAPECRIALAAPTGKAATRMQDAIRERAGALPEALRARLPQEAFTIHRLLGAMPGSSVFRHHRERPLPFDVLIVDEASMLDLALAAKLFDAVPPGARIILLGDKDQLAAVESGAVFSELSREPQMSEAGRRRLHRIGIDAARIAGPASGGEAVLPDAVVWLTHNYRFAASSAIGRLAEEIRAGDTTRALETIASADDSSVARVDDGGYDLLPATIERLRAGYAGYAATLAGPVIDADAIFRAFDRFRVLCAEREGPRGVRVLNELLARPIVAVTSARWPRAAHSPWYCGRPVMVLRNDYVLKVFNGDIGIALPGDDGAMMVHFRQSDGSCRQIAAVRLPEHETAFATTVHKAQGSEYDEVAVVLPAKASRVVTRELVYTAVTRARAKVSVISSADALRAAIDAPMVRHSGLIARLREQRRHERR